MLTALRRCPTSPILSALKLSSAKNELRTKLTAIVSMPITSISKQSSITKEKHAIPTIPYNEEKHAKTISFNTGETTATARSRQQKKEVTNIHWQYQNNNTIWNQDYEDDNDHSPASYEILKITIAGNCKRKRHRRADAPQPVTKTKPDPIRKPRSNRWQEKSTMDSAFNICTADWKRKQETFSVEQISTKHRTPIQVTQCENHLSQTE